MGIIEKVTGLIQNNVEENGYILSEVLYEKEGKTNFLRIIVDKKDGYINLDDCLLLNKVIGDILDREDPIEENYILDICSKEKGSV